MRALLDGLRWRTIGPYRGGRVVAVTGHPTDRLTFYFGSTGGGVWKTADGGWTWRNVSDGFFSRASVGAIALSTSEPSVLYVGMGECCLRNTVSHGDGIYRSDDGGRGWRHCGLEATRHIGRIRIDPRDPDRVYVAALGRAHGPNAERGVYRSLDGGDSWQLVLSVNEDAGAVDLAMDGVNPRVLYATTWRVRRLAWRIDSGGEGSGLWRSDDGGDTWVELSGKPGMPQGPLGRIGVTTSAARGGRVWAIVEAAEGGVVRSDDWGEHWVRLSDQAELRQRPFYYSHIHADPRDADTVWVLNVFCWRSTDGGHRFTQVPVQHGDCHDVWFDPADPDRLILGDDGGAAVSFDGGRSWSSLFNQPTAELYRVAIDDATPFNVYATQQDNTSIRVPNWSTLGAITHLEAREVGGGESGGIAVRPGDGVVFAANVQGYLSRYDQDRDQLQVISPWPDLASVAAEQRFRFNWTAPVLLSPHDPTVLYHGANVVLRSADEGRTWGPVSPDLTRADGERMRGGGGPITPDITGAETYCTITALAASPVRQGVLWAGSDDGLVHVTSGGADGWRPVTPADVPDWAMISCIEPSPHDASTAYICADNHRADDLSPYLWRTGDLGATWQRIDSGLPADGPCRVVREDPLRRGLLVAGGDAGVHVSLDGGGSWHRCGGLPVSPVHDLAFTGDDLVVATHGRSLWVLDDLVALRQATQSSSTGVRLYEPRPLVRFRLRKHEEQKHSHGGLRVSGYSVIPYALVPRPDEEGGEKDHLTGGENAERGVTVLYTLDEDPGDAEVRISVLDGDGQELRTVTAASPQGAGADATKDQGPRPTRRVGLNRWVWDTRLADGVRIEVGDTTDGAERNRGPEVPPGRYRIRLEVGDTQHEADAEIRADPRLAASAEDHAAQRALAVRLWRLVSMLNEAVNTLRRLRSQAERWRTDADADLAALAGSVVEEARSIEDLLVCSADPTKRGVTLDTRLASLRGAVAAAVPPTAAMLAVGDAIDADLGAGLDRLDRLRRSRLADLERRIVERGALAQPVTAPPSPSSPRPEDTTR